MLRRLLLFLAATAALPAAAPLPSTTAATLRPCNASNAKQQGWILRPALLLPRGHGRHLFALYAFANSTTTAPMGCIGSFWPSPHSSGYACEGGIRIAEVPLPWVGGAPSGKTDDLQAAQCANHSNTTFWGTGPAMHESITQSWTECCSLCARTPGCRAWDAALGKPPKPPAGNSVLVARQCRAQQAQSQPSKWHHLQTIATAAAATTTPSTASATRAPAATSLSDVGIGVQHHGRPCEDSD